MTRKSKQFRALVLSALMVLSVVAGTVAFTGSAAAEAGTISGTSVSPGTVDASSTNTYTFDLVAENVDTQDTTTGATVTFSIPSEFSLSADSASTSVNGGSVSVTDTSVDTGNNEVTVTFDDDAGTQGDTVDLTVEVTGVTAPSSTGDYDVGYTVNADADSNTDAKTGTVGTVTVESDAAPSVRKVLHYEDTRDNGDGAIIEIAMSEDVKDSTVPSATEFTVYDEDDEELDVSINNVKESDGRIVLEVGGINTNVDNIDIPGTIEDTSGNALSDGTVNEDVTVGAQTVVAGPKLTGNDYADSTTNVSYRGTKIAMLVGENTNMEWDGPGGYTLRRGSGENSLAYVWNTKNLDFGDYKVDTAQDGSDNANISLEDLGLTVNLDEDSYNDEEVIDGNVTTSAIQRPVTVELRKNDDTKQTRVLDVDSDGVADFEFDATDSTGNYTVLATDNTSGITTESDSFEISGAADNEASYLNGTKTITEQRGDMVNVTIGLQGTTDMATLAIGDDEEDNYQATIVVEDGNDDDEVKVQFNTYTAGQDVDDNLLVNVVDDDDEIVSVTQTADGTTYNDLAMLDAKDNGYTMSVKATEVDDDDVVDDPDNVGTLFLEERTIGDGTTWTAASQEDLNDLDNITAIQNAVDDGTLTKDSDIAFQDYVVHQASVSGVGGLLHYEAGGDTDTAKGLKNAIDEGTLALNVEQSGSLANVDANELDVQKLLDDGQATAVYDDDENQFYVIVPVKPPEDNGDSEYYTERDPEDGDEFQANLTVAGDRLLDKGDEKSLTDSFTEIDNDEDKSKWENSSAVFSVSDRTLDFAQDPYNVTASENTSIEGSTSVAPGTEITVRAESTGDTQPRFIYTNESVVVQEDGTFSTTFDFSNQSAGDTFDLTGEADLSDGEPEEIDGNVVEAVETTTETTEPTETTTETTEPTETTETTEQTTAMTTEQTTEQTTTQQNTPGFGVAVAVVALLAAALLATRRD